MRGKEAKFGQVQWNSSLLLCILRHSFPLTSGIYIHSNDGYTRGPDTEFAPPSEILKAISSSQSNVRPEARSTGHRPHSADWLYFHECLSNASSMEVRSYAANAKSVCSDEWKDQLDWQATSVLKRRHRRPSPKSGIGSSSIDHNDGRIFQCTFCPASFKKKHDWERHEKSRHLLLESWSCCSKGSVHVNGTTNEVTCVFCGHNDPDSGHIHAHGFTQCVARPVQERTFTRKDHLRQHLRLVHDGCTFHSAMEGWKNEKSEISSRCGFCTKTFDKWKDRVSHIANHFRQGELMSSWVGDWGFEPEVSKLLEHATLPESRSLNKTSNAGSAMAGEIMNAAVIESPEFDFNNSLESANFTDQLGIYQGNHLSGFPYLALESHGRKSSSQFQGALSDPIGVNWQIDDRRSETITTSSGDQSQDIEGDMDMNFENWPSCLDLDLFESEPSACLPSNISSTYSPQLPAVLQDNAGL
uniref:C2H2-type domain-containing protein n=1 Tax=Bionectria ochroleuca TaxID=29856 RepID=A0A8H7TQK7_BIOOC